MAAKPLSRLLFFIILIIAGVMVVQTTRSRIAAREQNEKRFISTYIALSLASEKLAETPDSLKAVSDQVYKANGVDSAWMANYSKKLSGNLKKSSRIWDRVIYELDSLRKAPGADTAESIINQNPL